MPEKFDIIYQSGEKIPFSGIFEVVGARLVYAAQRNVDTPRELKLGEAFPAYEGMEVCWHSVDNGKGQDIETSSPKLRVPSDSASTD